MYAQTRTRFMVIALAAVCALVLAAPVSAKDARYTPFVTDFPQTPVASESLTRLTANDRIHAGTSSSASARPAATVARSGGIVWSSVAIGFGAGLGFAGFVALAGLPRRGRRPAVA